MPAQSTSRKTVTTSSPLRIQPSKLVSDHYQQTSSVDWTSLIVYELTTIKQCTSRELGELLGLEPVSLMTKKSRLRWFGRVEHKDDNDWVKRCVTWEIEGIRQRECPKKTWWDFAKDDMERMHGL